MIQITNAWNEQLLAEYPSYPASEKIVINHGYIYLLEDSSYPEYIKLGMTRDLQRRYQEYLEIRHIPMPV